MNSYFIKHKVPILFTIVCIALLSLMLFQIHWLKTSNALLSAQFDQKVNLAMGNALADFNRSHQTTFAVEDLKECRDDGMVRFLPVEKGIMPEEDQNELLSGLSEYMTSYGINQKYKADIFNNSCQASTGGFCCPVSTKTGCFQEYSLGVSFTSREDYLFDEMKNMIISSILIFILLSTVSFLILRALIQQKKITDNNIDFFNNTAHELKTPLTNIGLALNFIQKRKNYDNQERYLNIIASENSKLKEQVDQVLSLSQLESGNFSLKEEEIDLGDLLTTVVEDMQLRSQDVNGQINLNISSGTHIIRGDKLHLSNVVRNLIDNGLKFAEDRPRIQIDLNSNKDNVIVRITDNGIGISKADQAHIFKKFQRVNTGDIRSTKGFGIGLSYAKTVMQMHKGLIQVQSELKTGSQFELSFPQA